MINRANIDIFKWTKYDKIVIYDNKNVCNINVSLYMEYLSSIGILYKL